MTNVNTLYWQDVNTGIAATCDTSNGTGKTIPGDLPDTPPPAVSTIELINFGDTSTYDGNCVTWSALTAAFEPIGLPWPFVAETEGASHVVRGKIKNVKVRVTESSDRAYQITGPGGGPGELSAEYDNNSGRFSILYDGGNSLFPLLPVLR